MEPVLEWGLGAATPQPPLGGLSEPRQGQGGGVALLPHLLVPGPEDPPPCVPQAAGWGPGPKRDVLSGTDSTAGLSDASYITFISGS